jgi:hypothetical protein
MEHLSHNKITGIQEDDLLNPSPDFTKESKKISLSEVEEKLSLVKEGSEEYDDLQKMREKLENE